jgi:hypothetical protein
MTRGNSFVYVTATEVLRLLYKLLLLNRVTVGAYVCLFVNQIDEGHVSDVYTTRKIPSSSFRQGTDYLNREFSRSKPILPAEGEP